MYGGRPKLPLIPALFKIDKICEYFIQTPLISDKNKNKLFGSKSVSIYSADTRMRAPMILQYFKNDSTIINQIFFSDNINENVTNRTFLDLICQFPNDTTKKIIKLMTDNDNIIRYRYQWQRLLQGINTENDYNYNPPFWSAVKAVEDEAPFAVFVANKLLKQFKDDPLMLYYLLGSNEYISSKMFYGLIKGGVRFQDTSKIMNNLLNETNISCQHKFSWFNSIFSLIFDMNAIDITRNNIVRYNYLIDNIYEIMTYFMCNDKQLFLKIINTKLDFGLFEGYASVWHWICRCPDSRLLQIVLNCDLLNYDEKIKLFTDNLYGNVVFKMSPQNIKIMKAFITEADQFKQTLTSMWDVIKYFDGDSKFIVKFLLNQKIFFHILHQKEIMQYIFCNKSKLSDKEILYILNEMDWREIMNQCRTIGVIQGIRFILEFLANDRNLLWNIMTRKDEQTWITWFGNQADANRMLQSEYIKINHVLSKQDQDYLKQEIRICFKFCC